MYSRVLLVTLLLVGVASGTAQINPSPFNLAGGDYSFTDWPTTSTAGTYPTSMALHMFERRIEPDQVGTSLNDPAVGDWTLAYNLTGNARITGQGTSGIRFEQTGTAQTGLCTFPGAAVLALNTTGRVNIRVTFSAQTVSIQPRAYHLRLQYRTSTSGLWQDAVGSNGNVVEHRSSTAGIVKTTYTWTMPTSLEKQPLVQVRWAYAQLSGIASGNRENIFLDDIFVRSDNPIGTPTQLSIMSISPVSPIAGQPFTVSVRSMDALGAVKNVATSTNVTLSLATGSGSLTGTLTGTIPAGGNTVTFTNVNYNVAEPGVSITASRTSGDVLTAGTSSVFVVNGGPVYAGLNQIPIIAYAGTPMNAFTVTVYRADNTVDLNYSGTMTMSLLSGSGSLTGTTSVTAVAGVAVFSNVIATTPGSVQMRVTIPGVPSLTLPVITVDNTPSLTGNIVPQYIHGGAQTTSCSPTTFFTPAYAQVTFTNLKPNTAYRYIVGAGNVAMSTPTSTGSGFNLHYNANTNTYTSLNSKNMTTTGGYSQFSTGATETTKTLWVNLLPTNTETFKAGKTIFWQVSLGDLNGTLIRNYQLSQSSLAQTYTTDATGATLIGDIRSQLKPLNYVCLYDNTTGTGRPLGVSIVQSYNAILSFTVTPYATSIENVPGSWMTQIPNTLATGVRRIEERDGRTGQIVYAVTSANGVWNGVGTYPLDPTYYPGGPGSRDYPIYLETPMITVSSPAAGDTLCAGTMFPIRFRADGMQTVRVEYSIDGGNTYSEIANNVPASDGTLDWAIPGSGFQGNCRVRVTGIDRPTESGVSGSYAIVEPLSIIGELRSNNLCLDDNDTLICLVAGNIESYTWYKDGQILPDIKGPFLHITDAHFETAGVYWCVVNGYGSCGDVTTNKAHIRVARETKVLNQSRAVAGVIGSTATLWVEAEFPDEVLAYQWYKGTTALVDDGHFFGANSNRLEIRNFNTNDYSNEYHCVITGICGVATSRVVRVFPTGVYTEFIDDTFDACSGGTVVLAADVYSNPAGESLVIRWYRNGAPMTDDARYSGTNTATLTISNVVPADAGEYEIRAYILNNAGLSSAATATVSIATTPVITRPPVGADVCEGEAASLGVTADAQGTITYQWYFNSVPIPGANEANLTISTMTAQRDGTYWVVVSTACGSVTSREAVLVLKTATTITQQPPVTLDVTTGQPLTITVTANGSGTLQYQWFKDGTALAGEVAATYTKAAAVAGDAGKYWVNVTSECGTVTSDTTTVNIQPVSSVDEDVRTGGVMISRVAPNPTAEQSTFTVSMLNDAFVSMQLVDATGNIVATIAAQHMAAGDHRFVVDTQLLATGMYSIHSVIGSATHVQSLVVVK